MDYHFTQDQIDLQMMTRDFAEKELIPIAAEYDVKSEFPMEAFKKAVTMGLTCLDLPEEWGGAGVDLLTTALIREELSRGDAGFSSAVGACGLGFKPINFAGTEEQKRKYADVVTGGGLLALGLTEPNAGSDVANNKTTAVKKGDKYILNGRKCFITNAPLADMTQSGFVATGIVYSRQFKSRAETNHACLLGFIFGAASMIMCTLAALAWFPSINEEDLPYLTVLQQLEGTPGTIFRIVYYVVLYVAYISTSGSLLLGGISRYKLILGKAVKNEAVCTAILIVFFLCASTVIGSMGLKAIVDRGYKILGGMRSWTWFYPLLILGPISIHRVNKVLRETGKITFPAGVGKNTTAQEDAQ